MPFKYCENIVVKYPNRCQKMIKNEFFGNAVFTQDGTGRKLVRISLVFTLGQVLVVYATDLHFQSTFFRAGGAGPTNLTLVGPKSCHLWSEPCNFSVQVGPIIVRLRFFSNGRTNLDLLPPLLFFPRSNL